MNKKKLSNAMNNVQRMLLLKGGAKKGEWNPRAQMRLESLLAKPIVVKNVKLPIGDHQPDAQNAPLEDGNPNSSSD